MAGSRKALVTGASSGFGLAFARGFAAAGNRVVGVARRADRLAALAAELGDAFEPLPLDLTDAAAVAGLGAVAPDVVFANAGLALGIGKAPEASLAEWDTMIAVNCTATVHLLRAVLPGMVARGDGHVVLSGSIASTVAYPGGNVYGASKAFVRQLAANLRADLHGSGVRVTLLEPAAARTEFSVVRFSGDAARADQVYRGFEPLSAEDVARAALWAVDQPRHVNIATIELWPTSQAPGGPVYHRT